MNALINKMERKFGKFAIIGLSRYIVLAYVVGYVLSFLNLQSYISLDPYLILHGQVWRIITWVLIPPAESNIFFIALMLYLYYSLGNTLEHTWGSFRFNLYIFAGVIFTFLGAFLMFGYYILKASIMDIPLAASDMRIIGYSISNAFSTYYINVSLLLAFAAEYPNQQLLFMFIIPLKCKWIGYFTAASIIFQFIMESVAGKIAIVISLLHFLIYFFSTRDYKKMSPKEYKRRADFRRAASSASGYASAGGTITKHKCAVCGRTEKDDPNLEFRFCSKCNGNYEYCQDHLFTHTHQ